MKRKVNISAPRSAREGCIPFSLTPVNPRLANGKNVFRARMRMRGTLSMADIADEMMRRTRMEDRSTCLYYLDLLHDVILEKTLSGYRLKTKFFETGLSIRGTFESVDDEFDPNRHVVLPTICATKAFKEMAASTKVFNVSKPLEARVISLMDAVTKSLNAFIGRNEIHIQGDGLGICEDNPDEGVFLAQKGKIIASATVLKSDAQIIDCRFEDPPPPGKYDLIVRCRNGENPSFALAETTLRGITVGAE